jgi:hypothetical protein
VGFAAAAVSVSQRAGAWGDLGKSEGRSRRTVPVPPLVINALREWKLACPKGELGLVFPNERGGVLPHGRGMISNAWHELQITAVVVTGGRQRRQATARRQRQASDVRQVRRERGSLYAQGPTEWAVQRSPRSKRRPFLRGPRSPVHSVPGPHPEETKVAVLRLLETPKPVGW